jgi:glycosyltransferase involved in cell wall biosynthesis
MFLLATPLLAEAKASKPRTSGSFTTARGIPFASSPANMIHPRRETATRDPETPRARSTTEDPSTWRASRPIAIAVLVDLELRREAGGHVKSWERFASAAVEYPDRLDLTLHFLGPKREVCEIAPNVRIALHRPLLSTRFFEWTENAPGHTDIGPIAFSIIGDLKKQDVIHTTDAFFAQAWTGLRVARWLRKPLVTSIHTDTPAYTRIYMDRLLAKRGKVGAIPRFVLQRLRAPERAEKFMRRRLESYARRCDWTFVSMKEDLDRIRAIAPNKASLLRRGIDKQVFHPRARDRQRLRHVHGIPEAKRVLLYVGRLDRTKNVPLLAAAARLLLDAGEPIHILCVGEGDEKDGLEKALGPDVTLAGQVYLPDLAWLYASSDLFVFPSATETFGNVAIEAKATGLPVVLSAQGGSAQHVSEDGADGVLVEGDRPEDWANAIHPLIQRPSLLKRMGAAARSCVEREWPSWEDVLLEDLLPVWEAAAAKARSDLARRA